jgi:hypothetical protein
MQAALLVAIFTLLFAVMASLVSNNPNSSQLKANWIAQTKAYFKNIELVVNNKLTPSYWQANPGNIATLADYIRNTNSLKQLSPSAFPDKALDPWGSVLQGAILTRTMPEFVDASTGAKVLAPVTGFLLVSPGPDRTLQTTLPTITGTTTLAVLQGVTAAGDDIVYTFTDEAAQIDQLKRIRAHLDRIAAAALQDYQQKLATYRAARVAAYQAQLSASGSVSDLDTMMQDGSDAPTFADLSVAAQRVSLGVDEDFREIEVGSSITGNGTADRNYLVVKSTSVSDTITLSIYNGSPATPWTGGTGGLLYQIKVKGN